VEKANGGRWEKLVEGGGSKRRYSRTTQEEERTIMEVRPTPDRKRSQNALVHLHGVIVRFAGSRAGSLTAKKEGIGERCCRDGIAEKHKK